MKRKRIRWSRIVLRACITLFFTIMLFSFDSVHQSVSIDLRFVDDQEFDVPLSANNSVTLSPEAPNTFGSANNIKLKRMTGQMIRAHRSTSDHATYDRPALDTIIDENNTIIGDASWLLDFGIIGFGKCGTSTMMIWLKEHPEVQAFGTELKELLIGKPGALVRRLYTQLQPGPYQRGYKAPQDIAQKHIMDYYRQYWPKAKLIVGIRHPVRWMESLYNFRVQNLHTMEVMPHPNKLIGACTKGKFHTCTDKGNFAYALLKIGKQNYPHPRPPTEIETKIAGRYRRAKMNTTDIQHMENPLFLYDLEQLSEKDDDRRRQFRLDMTHFMGLRETLPDLPHRKPGRRLNQEEQRRRDAMKIDICADEYRPLRNRLMEHAMDASIFIRTIFIKNPTVTVSSPDHFESLMEQWMVDPCVTAARNASAMKDQNVAI